MQDSYFQTRLSHDPRRTVLWGVLARYLERCVPIPPDAAVLDAGAGYCDFINQVRARSRHAVDLSGSLRAYAAPGVTFHETSCLTLEGLPDAHFDVALASNLLEHLDPGDRDGALKALRRVIKPGGRLVVLQPNFRYCYHLFFDDYTHRSPLSHVGLADLLEAHGYRVEKVTARFMPFSVKSRLPVAAWLVQLYLWLPFKPFAGQCLIVARREG